MTPWACAASRPASTSSAQARTCDGGCGAPEAIGERAAGHELHGEQAELLVRGDDRDDVRVAQRRDDLGLAQEAAVAFGRARVDGRRRRP